MIVRKLAVKKFDDIPRYCFSDLLTNYLIMIIYVFVPKGEQYFIDTIRKYTSKSSMSRQTRDFIRQESNHMALHNKYNQAIFKHFPILSLIPKLQNLFVSSASLFSLKANLAAVRSIEYFTALCSKWVIESKIDDNSIHSGFGQLLKWHSIEELEHISFVQELAEDAECTKIHHFIGSFIATYTFLIPCVAIMLVMIMLDSRVYSKAGITSLKAFLFDQNGAFRQVGIPFFLHLLGLNNKPVTLDEVTFQEAERSIIYSMIPNDEPFVSN